MHSPLPDSSALEAGIIQDERPTRLSRVQDHVRHLLRNSVQLSVRGSTLVSSPVIDARLASNHGSASPLPPSLRCQTHLEPDVLPSPASDTSCSTTSATSEAELLPGALFPPTNYTHMVQEMAHQSAMFNTRAVAALDHPDLSDASLAILLQQKTETRQQRAWKRSRNGTYRRRCKRRGGSPWPLCVFSGLVLAAIVATYITLATTTSNVSPTFHILFVLGILLAIVLFAHTLIRICLFNRGLAGSPPFLLVAPPRRRRHPARHQTPRRPHPRDMPTLGDGTDDFVPATPIPVQVTSDEVRPDSREAAPTVGIQLPTHAWDKGVDAVANPPPAYGRWRGSVRVNPDLLHWQPVPSPASPDTPTLPSPTYEEAVGGAGAGLDRTGPPSYVTRASPERRREMTGARPDPAPAQAPAPEMVEVRGVGLAA